MKDSSLTMKKVDKGSKLIYLENLLKALFN